MPYKDNEKQREYQRRWMAKRRQEWLDANGPCCECGGTSGLEVDHIDRSTKVSHRVWSWSEERREAELAKCQVLCNTCHYSKSITSGDRPARKHGTRNEYEKHGCRCAECTCANREHVAKVRAQWRLRSPDSAL